MYGFFVAGQNARYDSLVIAQDSIHFITYQFNHPEEAKDFRDSFVVTKSLLLDGFIQKYKLTVQGIDYSKQMQVQIDSEFVKRDFQIRNGVRDTACLESDFYNFHIAFSLGGKVVHRDTLFFSNTTSLSLLEILKQIERVPVYSEHSGFVGYLGYGSKLYGNEASTTFFIRTLYVTGKWMTKYRTDTVEVIDPVTLEPVWQQVKGMQQGKETLGIRRLIKE